MKRTHFAPTALVLSLFLALPPSLEAKTVRELSYRYNQIWSTAIRFLRVDNHFPISEKDKKSGYIMFDYVENGRKSPGSLEIIPTVVEGRKVVLTRIRIGSLPSYVEALLLDKLGRKLRDEYGQAPKPEIVDTAAKTAKDGPGKSSASGGEQNQPAGDEDDTDAEKEHVDKKNKE